MNELLTTRLVLQDGVWYHQESQDVEPVRQHAQFLRESGKKGDREMRHAGKIPTSVIMQYIRKAGITFHEFMASPEHSKAMLNSEEARPYRIWEGRV